MVFLGVKGSSSFEGVGFFRSSSQPDNDPRPYMQTSLATTLIGNEPSVHDTFRKWFNYNKQVKMLLHFISKYQNLFHFDTLKIMGPSNISNVF